MDGNLAMGYERVNQSEKDMKDLSDCTPLDAIYLCTGCNLELNRRYQGKEYFENCAVAGTRVKLKFIQLK